MKKIAKQKKVERKGMQAYQRTNTFTKKNAKGLQRHEKIPINTKCLPGYFLILTLPPYYI